MLLDSITHFAWRSILFSGLVCSLAGSAWAQKTPQAPHTLSAGSNGQFLLDGKPFQIRAGEMHYPRVPRADWRDRMKKLKAMGLNTLTTYVFWNVHETSPGHFDFSGQNDLAEYLREAQEQGLYVILRPGPYVCAEWEFGGFPAWLLKNHNMVVRSRDPLFMAAVHRWFAKLGEVVRPLILSQGGPIIAVQVENEYGAFGDDHQYMEAIKDELKLNGMGDGYLYTADGPDFFQGGMLPEIPVVVNFGPGDLEKAFAALKAERPDGPMMSGEYWAGWFDHWGQVHQHRSASLQESDLKSMLDHGYSFNLYMAEGGTTFGWMNGANSDGRNYEPDTTSYDYDAPIDERGVLRPKYFAFRDLITKATGVTPPSPPAEVPATAYPVQAATQSASLWVNLPAPKHSDEPLSMEDVDQSYGYILYTTKLQPREAGTLQMDEVHDYSSVYLDHRLIGTADRRLGQNRVALPAITAPAELEILVENTGRVNYTKAIREERKGITASVSLGGKRIRGWNIYSLPMDTPGAMKYKDQPCSGPCFFRTQVVIEQNSGVERDTYVNTTSMYKGMVWVSGHPLGRAWNIGPQGALFLPGSWLHQGANEIDAFELNSNGTLHLSTVDHPIFFESSAPAP